MFVDDDPDILELYGTFFDWLEDAPYCFKVKCVGNPIEAENLAKLHSVELLVTDLSMPTKNGVELLHDLRKVQPGLLALLVTGNITTDDRAELEQSGFDGIYAKPLNFTLLCTKVGTLLKQRLALADQCAGIVASAAPNE
ncbi:MAG: response regulator [Patescibacteria group bacterium]